MSLMSGFFTNDFKNQLYPYPDEFDHKPVMREAGFEPTPFSEDQNGHICFNYLDSEVLTNSFVSVEIFV